MSVYSFSEGFLWGAATSAHQVEGNNIHNDWWAWEQAGRVKTPSGLACDQYRRYVQDFDLAASLHHYTNPQWVTEAGGWANADVVDWFGRYTERVVHALGDQVRYWVTINE